MTLRPPEPEGWQWFEPGDPSDPEHERLAESFRACFCSRHGQIVLDHLSKRFLERRVPASASSAELRHTEGQRSAVAYIVALTRSGPGR